MMSNVEASDSKTLFHIVDRNDWKTLSVNGRYAPASIASDGFIHLSTRGQVLETANAFFKGRRNLLLLELDLPSSDSHLKFESAVGPGDRKGLFPHYYAKLPINFVRKIFVFEPAEDDQFQFPTQTIAH